MSTWLAFEICRLQKGAAKGQRIEVLSANVKSIAVSRVNEKVSDNSQSSEIQKIKTHKKRKKFIDDESQIRSLWQSHSYFCYSPILFT